MKRVLILLLMAAFLISVASCAPKSEYDKLMDQKKQADKKCEALTAEKAQLQETISLREKELKDLKNELKKAEDKVKDLEKQLASAKTQ